MARKPCLLTLNVDVKCADVDLEGARQHFDAGSGRLLCLAETCLNNFLDKLANRPRRSASEVTLPQQRLLALHCPAAGGAPAACVRHPDDIRSRA